MHAQNVANNAPAQGVSQMVRPLTKGIGRLQKPATLDEVAKFGWRLLNEDVTLPAAVLYEERLKHNLAWMQQFVSN